MTQRQTDASPVFEQGRDEIWRIEEYWTEERLSEARPIELSQLELSTTAGVPFPASVGQQPYSPAGKLFATTPTGNVYCSASFVGSSQMLLTAAHGIMSNQGVYFTNLLFVRASAPAGGGQGVFIKGGFPWANYYSSGTPNRAFDYAFLYTYTASGGGWLELLTGCPYATWTAAGYPENYGSGNTMYAVEGSKGTIGNSIVTMLQNPMSSGASGGPWIGPPMPSGNYSVIGSTAAKGLGDKVYGPLFDSNTTQLYQLVYQWGAGP